MQCECKKDGFCERYQKPMEGRMREICQGTNVDPSIADSFRQLWLSESIASGHWPAPVPDMPKSIILQNNKQLGDVLVMTAAIRSLTLAHPGKFIISTHTKWPDLFANNPDVTPIESVTNAVEIDMHYPVNDADKRAIHFMQGYCEHLSGMLNVPIPLAVNAPCLYLSDAEKSHSPIRPASIPTWIIAPGMKSDFTNKFWGTLNYQFVVKMLHGIVRFVQIGTHGEYQPRLDGVINLVGKTPIRDLIRLVHHADGVLCGVSFPMHLAAALGKPCVCIMGGREPVQWNAYPLQHTFHTIGALPCCQTSACWRSRVKPIDDGNIGLNASLCDFPTAMDSETLPACMTKIDPIDVARKITATIYRHAR